MNVFYRKGKRKPSDGDLKVYKSGKMKIRVMKIHSESKVIFSEWYDYFDRSVSFYRKQIENGNIKFVDESFPKDEKNLEFNFD